MHALRQSLEDKLQEIQGLTIGRWKDTDLVCLFYHGKEVAHFHGDTILDLRLSSKIIREEQLSRAVSAQIHPKRSQNSRWIGVAVTTEDDVPTVVHLVRRACEALG